MVLICDNNIFAFNANCVDAFRWLFDCSKGHFNRQSLKAVVRSRVVLYCIRIDVRGGGGGSALNVNLTLSVDKSIFGRPLNHIVLQLKRTNIAAIDLLSFYLVCVRRITEYACKLLYEVFPSICPWVWRRCGSAFPD